MKSGGSVAFSVGVAGAAEGAAYDVPAGGTGSFNSYGLGEAPAGDYTTEVSALGVNY